MDWTTCSHAHTQAHIYKDAYTDVCATLVLACSHINALPCNFIKFSFFFLQVIFFSCFLFLFWASELTNGSRLTERATLLFIKPYDAHISPHTQYTCTHPCTNTMHTQKIEQVRNACREFYTLAGSYILWSFQYLLHIMVQKLMEWDFYVTSYFDWH